MDRVVRAKKVYLSARLSDAQGRTCVESTALYIVAKPKLFGLADGPNVGSLRTRECNCAVRYGGRAGHAGGSPHTITKSSTVPPPRRQTVVACSWAEQTKVV